MQKKIIASLIGVLVFGPLAVHAQNVTDLWSLGLFVLKVIGRTTQLLWTLAIMSFLFGLVQFIQKADVPAEREKAKKFMVASVVAFTVAISFWALVNFLIQSSTISPDTGALPIIDSSGQRI